MDDGRILPLVPGDAFGAALWEALHGGDGRHVVERDDGYVDPGGAAEYFTGPDAWSPLDVRALDLVSGRILDVGAGAGRFSLAIEAAGHEAVALDVSPLAVAVCAARGLEHTFIGTVDALAAEDGKPFDAIAMMGSNLALFEAPQRARQMLDIFRALGGRDVSVVGTCRDPYVTDNPDHLSYHDLNRDRGRMPGCARLRVRFERLATEWFDYLFASPAELANLVAAAGWKLADVTEPGPDYLAVLRPA